MPPRSFTASYSHEQPELVQGIVPGGGLRLVGYGEVGVYPLGDESGQTAGSYNIVNAGVKMLPGAEITQPGHSRIQLYMYFKLPAQLKRLLGIFKGLGKAGDRLGDVQGNQSGGIFTGGGPE